MPVVRPRRPLGPQGGTTGSPGPGRGTYLRRRVLVTVLALLLLAGLVVGGAALVRWVGGLLEGSEPAATTEPSPTETAAAPVGDCTAADVQVALTLGAAVPRLGSTVPFEVSIAHVGAAPCTLDAGRTARELVITSGADRVWSSADCDSVGPRMLLLAPGNQDAETVEWPAERSAPECVPDLPAISAGTYQAVVDASGVMSEPLTFTLEG